MCFITRQVAANLDDKIKQLVPMLQNRNGPVVIYVSVFRVSTCVL